MTQGLLGYSCFSLFILYISFFRYKVCKIILVLFGLEKKHLGKDQQAV